MNSCYRLFAGCTLVLGLAACDNAVSEPKTETKSGVEVGAAAPQFDLPGSDGQTHKLSDYSGQHVVLAFFPKAFTGG